MTSSDHIEDAQLWRDYCAGDTRAFDTLYQRYRGPLYRYVQRLCNGCSESEELYQDVWAQAIKARDRFQGVHLRAWLFTIAHNRVIDFFRAAHPEHSEEDPDSHADNVSELHPSWPERWLTLRDCVERLFQLLTGLSPVQRNAFLLKEEAGLSLEEIGDVTGVGRETVKSRLRYAMNRLRGGLEDCDERA